MTKGTDKARVLVVTALVAALTATSAGSALAQTAPGAPAPPDDREIDHHGHDDNPHPYQPQVRIGVAGMDRGTVELRDGVVPVEVVNQRDEAVNFDFAVDVQADGVNSRIAQRAQTLAPRATSQFRMSLDSLGIRPERLRGAAVLTLRATTHDAAGKPIDGVVNPSLYLSRERNRVVLYDETRLLGDYKGGTIRGVGTVRPSPETINLFAGSATGTFDPEADLPVAAAGLHTICVKWQYASADHDAGEAYYTQGEPMAARGVKLLVNQGGLQKTVYADKNTGCTSLPLVDGKIAKVVVFSEAKIGTNDNITVRAFVQPEGANPGELVPKTQANLKKWSYYLVPGSGTSHLNIPAGYSSTMMAYGSFSARQLDRGSSLTEPAILDLQYEHERTNSGAGDQTLHIAASQYDRKFMYGHEVGHWFNYQKGLSYSLDYTHESAVPACTSADAPNELLHLKRSTEVNQAAFSEGLADFFATVVWNGVNSPSPMYRYGKDLTDPAYGTDIVDAYHDFKENENVVDMAGIDIVGPSGTFLGGERAWRDAKCTSDDPAKYSVELDWTRFLVNYLQGDRWWGEFGGEDPTFADLIALLQYTEEHYIPAWEEHDPQAPYDIYAYLMGALADPGLDQQGFVDRFEAYATAYGVTQVG